MYKFEPFHIAAERKNDGDILEARLIVTQNIKQKKAKKKKKVTQSYHMTQESTTEHTRKKTEKVREYSEQHYP